MIRFSSAVVTICSFFVRRKASLSGSPSTSPLSSPKLSRAGRSTPSHSPSATPPGSPSIQTTPWKSRLHTIKNSFLGSPRFHRRKMQGEERGREGWKDRDEGGGTATLRGINVSEDGGDSHTTISDHITNLLLPSNGVHSGHLIPSENSQCLNQSVLFNSTAGADYLDNYDVSCSSNDSHFYGPPDYTDVVVVAKNGYGPASRPADQVGNSRQDNSWDIFGFGSRTDTEGRDYLTPPASPNLSFRTNHSPLRDRDEATSSGSCSRCTAMSPPSSRKSPLSPPTARGNNYTSSTNSATALRDRDFIGIRVNNSNNVHGFSTAAGREREYLSMRNSILGSPRFHRRNMPGELWWSCMQVC